MGIKTLFLINILAFLFWNLTRECVKDRSFKHLKLNTPEKIAVQLIIGFAYGFILVALIYGQKLFDYMQEMPMIPRVIPFILLTCFVYILGIVLNRLVYKEELTLQLDVFNKHGALYLLGSIILSYPLQIAGEIGLS